ncbi:outer membrane protein assembly factor BamD [uncultured Cyclobacterium sp.]|uniref:outer membrane protein assembly factor BamD n=1 Tax=uncultured Cyclobacterium sp. TaxID=453820 RepID=UPI0030EBE281|tara:strand:+ start:88091 stop:89017 length:927 start_codon:yes stop_codon:yes gene_type:complete
MTKVHQYIFIFLASLLTFGCGEFYKLEKSTNWDELYEAANRYYDEGEHNKAIILYDRVLPVIKGSGKAELAEFNYAYAHFRTKRYIEAAEYFKTFFDTYNRSPLAEEALFMNAYSLYLDSPDYNLDQKSSREAVNAIQLFMNRFPESDSYERSITMIDDLQKRFEEKAFEESKMYYRLTEGLFPGDFYRACIVNFQNFAKSFPDSDYNEELAFKLVEVSTAYADRSVFDKKEERFEQALEFAAEFAKKFPESEYLKNVSNIQSKAKAKLDDHYTLKEQYKARTAEAIRLREEEKKDQEDSEALIEEGN